MRLSFVLLVVLAHCDGFNEVPTRCRVNKDCPRAGGDLFHGDPVCVFDLSDGCDGRGHCTQLSRSDACEQVACGCDGKPAFLVGQRTPFLTECADGFDKPIASMNACSK